MKILVINSCSSLEQLHSPKQVTNMVIRTQIKELELGSVGIVVGYDRAYGGYTGRLMKMGLTPETQFVVLSTTCEEDAVEILLEKGIIKLSKSEANALCIEEMEEN